MTHHYSDNADTLDETYFDERGLGRQYYVRPATREEIAASPPLRPWQPPIDRRCRPHVVVRLTAWDATGQLSRRKIPLWADCTIDDDETIAAAVYELAGEAPLLDARISTDVLRQRVAVLQHERRA
jgi:hypothetical protein